MSLTLTNDSKNTLNLTKEGKDDTMTWDSSDPETWDDGPGFWDSPRRNLVLDSKNTLAITNENKL
jgi:hypothetical protein